MPRILATILMLLTAVGPPPCRCPLFAQPADEPAHQVPAAPTPGPCCHCHQQTPPPVSTTDQAPRPFRNPDQPCPCQRLRDSLPALLTLFTTKAGLDLAGSASPFDWLPATTPELFPAVTTASGSDPPLPFLTAQDLLRAHHQLRC